MIAVPNHINWKKTTLSLITHPVFLSMAVTLAVILLFIPPAPKYSIHQIDQIYNTQVPVIFYDDLDGNGYSDRILVSNYIRDRGFTALAIRLQPALFLQEWDFHGTFINDGEQVIRTGDFDGNGRKEVYLFTVSQDSVFLHIVSDFFNKTPVHASRFISVIKILNGKPDLRIITTELTDMNQDGFKDFVFAISCGFPVYPRKVFIYDIHNDSLITSTDKNGFCIQNLLVRDINGDKNKEIVLTGYAAQNVKDASEYPIHDLCCWLIVFDHNLSYLFPPVKFPYLGYSGIINISLPNNLGFFDLYSAYSPPQGSGKSTKLYRFGNNGEVQQSCSIPGIRYDQVVNLSFIMHKGVSQLIVQLSDGAILSFDPNLTETNVFPEFRDLFFPYDTLDIDGDHQKEIISVNVKKQKLIILRADLSQPAYFQLPDQEHWDGGFFSLKKAYGKEPVLVMYNKNNELHFTYHVSMLYYTRWGIYLGIFLMVYLFTILIQKIQRIQDEKRFATEKKITELQLKIVKNQMDPHFTLNAINSVKEAIGRQEKEEAGLLLNSFAGMYRSLLLSADTIQRTLAAEIDFCTNYLALEKFRMQNRFDYSIIIDPSVNTAWEVPKMILQSHVENAVKHGLYNKPEGGFLRINIYTEDHSLVLEIEDNGQGRSLAGTRKSDSTGKGLKIMDQLLDLYFKITGVKVTTEISDICDENMQVTGTKVRTVVNIV